MRVNSVEESGVGIDGFRMISSLKKLYIVDLQNALSYSRFDVSSNFPDCRSKVVRPDTSFRWEVRARTKESAEVGVSHYR